MSGYLAFFKSELLVQLQYRASAIAGLVTQFFWGMIYALVYTAFYNYNHIDSINIAQLMSYVWLNQAFIRIIYLNDKDPFIVDQIKTGTVAYELCKPYDLYSWWYLKLLARRYAATALRCLPIIIVAFFLPSPYGLSLPASPMYLLLFVLTLILGSFLITTINMIVQTITFYTYQDKGISSIVYSIGGLLGGFCIPLPLMPDFVLKIANVLPFRYIGDLPFRLYSANIDYAYGFQCILIQIAWIVVLFIIGKLLMKLSLKKVSIQGG